MIKAVTFGEIMLRLSPPGFERLFQSPELRATFGGGEANVAVSLAQFGFESHYVTRLPTHAVGEAALKVLREGLDRRSTDTDLLVRLGELYESEGAAETALRYYRDAHRSAPDNPKAAEKVRRLEQKLGAQP